MYQKNSHNTTGTLPVKIKSFNRFHHFFGKKGEHLFSQKGSRSTVTAFLLLVTVFLFLGCESPGLIGEDIISDDDNIETRIDTVDQLSVHHENSFSGRLPNTSLGYVEDPVFGTIKSVALLKPSISRAQVDTIFNDDKIHLKLIFRSDVYGSELSVSDYEIFEANEVWRGNQLRYNSEIPVNYASKVAEFQVIDEDTVWVEMSREWTNKFAEYFNNTAADRDSLYRNSFPGLAIVPSESNQQIRFLRNLIDDEDEQATSFFVESEHHNNNDNGNDDNGDNGNDDENGENGDDENGNDDNGNGEEDEDDGLPQLGVRDWGASFVRTSTNETTDGIVLHNTGTALQVEFDLPVDELSSKNIVNAQLILSLDTSPEFMDPNFVRPQTNLIRAHVFNDIPRDLAGEIFTTGHSFSSQIDEDEDTFKIDITQYVLNEVFGDLDERKLFLTVQTTNGLLYSSIFYGADAPENKKPRIVITSVK